MTSIDRLAREVGGFDAAIGMLVTSPVSRVASEPPEVVYVVTPE